MSETFVEALQLMIESSTSDVNTSLPGKIVSYNAKTNRAIVQPMLPKRSADGEVIPVPNIVEVPMVFPTSGMNGKQAAITLPVAPGDGVMLNFTQRSIENWLGGNNDAPDDPRQFDLSDCVATPGLNAAGVEGNADNLVIRMDKASFTLQPDNTIVMGNENGSITIAADGTITIKGQSVIIDTPANTYVTETHTHGNVRAGGDTTSQPL